MPAFVPGFTHDLFVSYSHLDNKSVEGVGWVTDLGTRLGHELGVVLGSEPAIWTDDRIGPADVFPVELDERLRQTAVLVAIISPGYMNSRWCEWELNGFLGKSREGDIRADNKSRAIKVVKLPTDEDMQHAWSVLPEVKGIEFYKIDRDGQAYEFPAGSEPFVQQVKRLARDVAAVLKSLRRQRTVFLGDAPPAMQGQREKVQQELRARDYRVISTPPDASGSDSIRTAMAESSLALHFVDSARPPDAAKATDLAREAASEAGTRQMVVVRSDEDAEQHPWHTLPAAETAAPTEVLVNPATHSLKDTVLQTLKQPVEPPRGDDLVRVYLICHQDDHPLIQSNRARALRDYLLQRRVEVKVPLAEKGTESEFSRDNRAKLKACDAVVLYWGASRQGWFEQRLQEVSQAVGWRKGRRFCVKAGYVADPGSPIKQNFETNEVDVLIKQFQALDEDDARFQEFLARLPVPVP